MQACMHTRPSPASFAAAISNLQPSLSSVSRLSYNTSWLLLRTTPQTQATRIFQTSATTLQDPTTLEEEDQEILTALSSSSPLLPPSSLPSLPPPKGHIELVIGPMFAGKSSELLRRIAVYEAQGLTVALIKSDTDNRYSAAHVVTHDGLSRPCFATPSLAAFREMSAEVYAAADVIAVDEAQFFPDLAHFCTTAADEDAKRIILAGLDGDFLRRKFGQVLDLVPLADKVTKLTAICKFCEHEAAGENNNNFRSGEENEFPALFSLRLAAEGGQQVVGGADKYAPVCRRHYVELMSAQIERNKDDEEV